MCEYKRVLDVSFLVDKCVVKPLELNVLTAEMTLYGFWFTPTRKASYKEIENRRNKEIKHK